MSDALLEAQVNAGGMLHAGGARRPPVAHFGDATVEYRAAREAAAVFDVSDRVQIEVAGRDRVRWLNSFCTNDIKRLAVGEGCEAFVTNVKGRVVGHVFVFAGDESLWVESSPGTETALLAHLERYIITEDVSLLPHTEALGELLVAGPRAAERLTAMDLATQELKLHQQVAATLGGRNVAMRRVDLTGGAGFLLSMPREHMAEVWSVLAESNIRPAGFEAHEALRIEAGMPLYGIDVSDENIAQEVSRTRQAISFTKGCYLGQEPIARLDAMGHTNRELRGLKLEGGDVPSAGAAVVEGEADIGRITSAARSPADGRPVALAYLKSRYLRPGTRVSVQGREGTTAATVFWNEPHE
ncbi:MAG: hypothetical protein KY476_04855 [Planctomycetes bacterium]|nr:hypothetical protein [Planctomycetota bacterium]